MRLLVVGADGPELRLARRALPPALWEMWAGVEGLAPADRQGVRALPEPSHAPPVTLLARALDEVRPNVVYTPALVKTAAVPDALQESGSSTRWLAGVRDSELDLDLQPDDGRVRVERALALAHGLLPRSGAAGRALEDLAVGGRIFDWVAPAAPIDMASLALPRRRGRMARRIVVDGRHDLLARAQVALAGLRLCAGELAGWRVVVLNPTADVEVAARLLGGDTSIQVEIVQDASPRQIFSAHEHAVLSIRLSLSPDLDWWETAALTSGAAPILGRQSVLSDRPRSVPLALVEPDDPHALAAAVRRLALERSPDTWDGLRGRAFARRLYASTEARLGFAVMSLATGR